MADRDRPRPLRAAGDLGQPAAPVLADQRRDDRRHASRLPGARSLGPRRPGRLRCGAGLLFRLAGLCRHRQPHTADRHRRCRRDPRVGASGQRVGEAEMPQAIRAVVVDPAAQSKLAIKPVELRDPDRDEVGGRVTAISLNRGETRRALQVADAGWRPGWDFAGVVESEAADGSGPKRGTRVVGILPSGAWAERVNCRSHAVAALPDAVSDSQAATLPVAGLTALHALRQGGLLLGRKGLLDGASGGVGHLRCPLANAARAHAWGHVRRPEYRDPVAGWCDGRVVLGPDLGAAKPHGPFWLIVDSVGASALSAALGMLAPNGICVTLGVSEGSTATFESRDFFS